MAFSDADQISTEEHELDYVLSKWGERTTKANRAILAAELGRFKADPENKPWTRTLFYAWAERTGLKDKLEDKPAKGVGASKTASADPAGDLPAKKGGGRPWWWWLIAAILIVALVILAIFLIRTCASSGASRGGAADAGLKASAPAGGGAGTSVDAAAGSVGAVASEATANIADLEAPAAQAELKDLAALPARALSIRFQPNSPSALASGEEAKIGLLATALKAFSSGKLLVTGYCAAVGDKAGDGALTKARADAVAQRLRAAGVPAGIGLRTVGAGATGGADKDSWAASRRVDIGLDR